MDEMLRWRLRCRYCEATFVRSAVNLEELRRYIRGQQSCSYSDRPHTFMKDSVQYYEVKLEDVTRDEQFGWTRLAEG